MPTSSRPSPQTSFDDDPPGIRRSKRLGHVEIEDIRDFEALRTRKRRRTREDPDEGDIRGSDEVDQNEDDDAATSTPTAVPTAPRATDRRDRRQVRTNLRVNTLRKAVNTTRLMDSRSSEVAKAPRAPDHISRDTTTASLDSNLSEARPPRFISLTNSEHAAETEPVGDVYEFRASSPRKPKSQKATPARPRSRRTYTPQDFETGNGLFVQQEADDGDESDENGNEGDGNERDETDGDENDGDENEGDENDGDENDGDENEGDVNGQDETGADVHLYDDPTIVGLPPSAQTEGQATEDAVHGAGPQSSAATEQLQRLVVDMGSATPEPSDEADEGYPDDDLIFNEPTRQDRVATAPMRSYSLKSITELMGGNGWTRSRQKVTPMTNKDRLSKRTRPLWKDLCHLGAFWEGMPRAPLFDQQCDYLHSGHEDATRARQTIRNVDSLVSVLAHKAKKPSRGEESHMPPPRFVVDLYESIVPLLVDILGIVFHKGAETEGSWYTGRFTKISLQIMQRLVAWIHRLYEAMQASLARRRLMEQSLSKRTSREKLGEYLRGFESELEQIWEKTDEIIERQQLYEQKLLKLKARKEREQRELEEARRRQREVCDRRLHERLRRDAVQPSQMEAYPSQYPSRSVHSSQLQSSQRTSRGTQQAAPARIAPRDRGETAIVGPSKPWPEDDAKKLLQILTTRPWTEMESLVWEFERSEEDVQAMVELLKRSARTYAASKGKTVPAFAAN
ncbi:hypothetical protein CGRA01v4_00142 [Colletotrichum graminicola]|uniref:Uncharacterized protein n=1 Tax=Colletotrichum graminicola (strain M1.001 / M2 / FGSC 10212) TaxID=645133 RepID=E3QU97_COLGM|nr:uncharacterized protein GLRG_09579 [Colletotrichum graminicola M1.001]EFQ34435.1 hypothetical protein GLRG_09579 [Colletotrichum graminicola M1.001]WDK08864.1 hypothetical protein CGRA01v4_00142 [Colletotrichum graminicola]